MAEKQITNEEAQAINEQLRATITNLQTRIGQIAGSYEVEIAYLKAQNSSMIAALKAEGKTTIFGESDAETAPAE